MKRGVFLTKCFFLNVWLWSTAVGLEQTSLSRRNRLQLVLSEKGERSNNEFAKSQARGRSSQIRYSRGNRKKRKYWEDSRNILHEVQQFWLEHTGKPSSLIPNLTLLIHFKRYDLKEALIRQGDREQLSQNMGVPIMDGRWKVAVRECPELRQLIQQRPGELSMERPPSVTKTSQKSPNNKTRRRWAHLVTRRPKGYWNLQRVIKELYEYVEEYQQVHGRPSVWMPRPSELQQNGRDDLKQAITRYGGAKRICRLAGMVPYRDWYYFEGQLELVVELKLYLDQHTAGDYSRFPTATLLQRNGYDKLYALIQYYGGRKFVAARLGMNANNGSELNWGAFDLEFAEKLLVFVRSHELRRSAPLAHPVIAMPSQRMLASSGDEGVWLDERIQKYGGYENVARRMGLILWIPK